MDREIDGVAIIDSKKVIAQFRSKRIIEIAEKNDYNIAGKVPVINPLVAREYLKIKEG